jgi:dihydroorotate dehydrogenase
VHPHAAPLLGACNPVLVAGLVAPQAKALAELLGLGGWAAREFDSLTATQLCVLSSGRIVRLTVDSG